MSNPSNRTASGVRAQPRKRLKLAAAAALLAAATAAMAGCGERAPQARNVSADVYGHDSRSVTSDVYTPNSWRGW